MRAVPGLLGMLLGLIPAPAGAYTVEHAEVHHRQGDYSISFAVRLEAGAEQVRALITDYDHLDRLSPAIVASKLIETLPDGARRVRVDMHACVLKLLCRNLLRIEDTRIDTNGDIVTVGVDGQGDFLRTAGRWRIVTDGPGSHLYYESALTPRFFVPPLVGPYLIRRALLRELEATAARLEQLAASVPAAAAPIVPTGAAPTAPAAASGDTPTGTSPDTPP